MTTSCITRRTTIYTRKDALCRSNIFRDHVELRTIFVCASEKRRSCGRSSRHLLHDAYNLTIRSQGDLIDLKRRFDGIGLIVDPFQLLQSSTLGFDPTESAQIPSRTELTQRNTIRQSLSDPNLQRPRYTDILYSPMRSVRQTD